MRLMRWRIVTKKRTWDRVEESTANVYYRVDNFFLSLCLFFFFSLSFLHSCQNCCSLLRLSLLPHGVLGFSVLLLRELGDESGSIHTQMEPKSAQNKRHKWSVRGLSLEEMQEVYRTHTCKLRRKQLSHKDEWGHQRSMKKKEATKQGKVSKNPQIK